MDNDFEIQNELAYMKELNELVDKSKELLPRLRCERCNVKSLRTGDNFCSNCGYPA